VTEPLGLRGYGPRECGSCRWWRPILEDGRGPLGPCRLSVRTGDFPGTAPICERYLSREKAVPSSPLPPPPRGRTTPKPVAPAVHRGDEPEGPLPSEGPPRPGAPFPEELTLMTREEFLEAIREALGEEAAPVRLAPRWEGGTVVLRPKDPATQSREIPLDSLFHKIVMIRDRLRLLEQRINAHEKLSDAEKVEMQQYLTRCYGSLTTFNLLFREDRDRFVGDKA